MGPNASPCDLDTDDYNISKCVEARILPPTRFDFLVVRAIAVFAGRLAAEMTIRARRRRPFGTWARNNCEKRMKARRKITAVLPAALIAAGFALPALAQGMPNGGSIPGGGIPSGGVPGGGEPSGDRSHDTGRTKAPKSNPNDDAEGLAEDLRLKGRCDLAVPMLRKFAKRAGYEISQYGLGLCLLALAKEERDGANAVAMNKEGAEWVLRAANAGFAQAQAEAVTLYVDGLGVDNDPIEAAKWALLYDENGYRTVLGLPDIAPDVRSKLEAALNAETRKQAQRRADEWAQTTPVAQGEP